MKDPNLCNTPEPCLSIDNIEIWESFSLCTSAAMWSFGRAFSRKSNIGIFFCYFIYQWNLRSRCVPIKQSQFFQCKAVFHPQGPFAHLNKVTTTNWLIIHAASCRAQTRNLQRKGQHSKKGPSIHGYDCLLGYPSSAAQGGGGSFKDRKEWLVGASVAESQVVGVSLFHCIEVQVFIHLPCCLSIYLTIYLSPYLTI